MMRTLLIALALLLLLALESNAQDTLTVNRGGTITIRVGGDGGVDTVFVPSPADTVRLPGDTVVVEVPVIVVDTIQLPPPPPDTILVELPPDTVLVELPPDTVLVELPPDTVLVVDTIYVGEPGPDPGPVALLRSEHPQTGFLPHEDTYRGTHTIVLDLAFSVDRTTRQGIFSKDHTGYGTGGHLSMYLENDTVYVRHQDTTSHVLKVPAADGRLVYTFGPEGRVLTLVGAIAGSDYALDMAGNAETIAVGFLSWNDAPGASEASGGDGGSPFKGSISLLALFADALTQGEAAAIPSAPEIVSVFDSLTIWPEGDQQMLVGETMELSALAWKDGKPFIGDGDMTWREVLLPALCVLPGGETITEDAHVEWTSSDPTIASVEPVPTTVTECEPGVQT